MTSRWIGGSSTGHPGKQFRSQSGLEGCDRALWLQMPRKAKSTRLLPSFMMANGFFEHLGLVGGLSLVAIWDWTSNQSGRMAGPD